MVNPALNFSLLVSAGQSCWKLGRKLLFSTINTDAIDCNFESHHNRIREASKAQNKFYISFSALDTMVSIQCYINISPKRSKHRLQLRHKLLTHSPRHPPIHFLDPTTPRPEQAIGMVKDTHRRMHAVGGRVAGTYQRSSSHLRMKLAAVCA